MNVRLHLLELSMCLDLNVHCGGLSDLGLCIDWLFHLDLLPTWVVFPVVKMFRCERAHSRHFNLI